MKSYNDAMIDLARKYSINDNGIKKFPKEVKAKVKYKGKDIGDITLLEKDNKDLVTIITDEFMEDHKLDIGNLYGLEFVDKNNIIYELGGGGESEDYPGQEVDIIKRIKTVVVEVKYPDGTIKHEFREINA